MLDPRQLYTLIDEVPELGRPVLVEAVTGFVDAGNAVRLASEQLLSSAESRVLATFDIDQLLDYRSRRPTMVFNEDHWEAYDEPRLAVYLLGDRAGVPFLLLAGPEPDVQWRRFTAAVRNLIDEFGVRLTVGLNAIPMAVPHTRPIGITAHANRRDLISGYEPWVRRILVPGSAGHVLEWELSRAGRDAMGFAVHVPHYVAQTDYPSAAEALLDAIFKATGLLLTTGDLHAAAEQIRGDIDRRIAEDKDASAVVRALEQQYDAFVRGRQQGSLLATATGSLPTAEELAAEVERYLAEQNQSDNPPDDH